MWAACALGVARADDAAPKAQPAGPPSLDAFAADPDFSNAQLSPNGQQLAMVVRAGGIPTLTVTDLATDKTTPVLVLADKGKAVKGLSVDWIKWKSDDRLIVGMTMWDVERSGGKQSGEILSIRYGHLMTAMDRDGKNQILLLKGNFWNSDRGKFASLLDRLRDDPDHILAIAPTATGAPAVWKVNIRTGEGEQVETGDENTIAWETDRNEAIVERIRQSWDNVIIEGRAPGEAKWSLVAKIRPKDAKSLSDFEFLGAATDRPAQLYVAVKPKDKSEGEFRSLRIYDFAAKTLSDPVWPNLQHDVDDIVYDTGTYNLAGVCYTIDVETCDFNDRVVTANYRGIEKFFDGKRNVTPVSTTKDGRWWLFSVSGPDEPEGYYLYDWQTKDIELLAERYQGLPTEALAPMNIWTYPTRDGATIHAYLTRPSNIVGPAPPDRHAPRRAHGDP